MSSADKLRRLLTPERIAMFGGEPVAEAIRQCRRIGFGGEIWPVHPRRDSIEGIPCYPDVAALPTAPDAAFLAVPRESTVAVLEELRTRGTAGAVCHASGFAEVGPYGAELQQRLAAVAGDMAVIGPNCIGVLNYLDGAALWSDQHGGHRVSRGVALITQSGNIAQNITMQRRSLPVAQVITLGNAAVTGVADVVAAASRDPRITAIGLHLEGLGDVADFSRAALEALRRGVPIVALKTGSSPLGARMNLSHTSSLAGSDVLCDALFRRLGIARVDELPTFVETLKLLHVHGPLADVGIASASCSGGEAALIADIAQRHGAELPELPDQTADRLRSILGEGVHVANPLDYHAYIWGDEQAQRECFTALLEAGFAMNLLLLDVPRADRCSTEQWRTTANAFAAARAATGARACVVSSLPEGIPDDLGEELVAQGVAPMQGMANCVRAIAAAGRIGTAQRNLSSVILPDPPRELEPGDALGERDGKEVLTSWGVDVPPGVLATAEQAPAAAAELGFPVVVKASGIAHKSEAGAVRVDLPDTGSVRDAVASMAGLADEFLVERMVQQAVVELIVGVRRDARFGLALTLGSGGVLVELLRDSVTVLLPAGRAEIEGALRSLRIWPLLEGFRGRPAGDVPAVVNAISAIAEHARRDHVVELDVNPLLVLPRGHGVVAADVLLRRGSPPA